MLMLCYQCLFSVECAFLEQAGGKDVCLILVVIHGFCMFVNRFFVSLSHPLLPTKPSLSPSNVEGYVPFFSL